MVSRERLFLLIIPLALSSSPAQAQPSGNASSASAPTLTVVSNESGNRSASVSDVTNKVSLTQELPDYHPGDVVREDIVTPVPLVVINADETTALKQKEASRTQVICRYNTNALNEAEEKLRNSFASVHSNFLARIESAYNRPKLNAQQLENPKFERLCENFQRAHKNFPLTTNLARLWAQGETESEHVLASSLSAMLREEMARPVRAYSLPPELKLTAMVRLVAVGNWDELPSLEDVEKNGKNLSRTNIAALGRLRQDLLAGFSEDQKELGAYFVSFIRSNCAPDLRLTQEARAKRIEHLWAADRYEAGQVIARRGQLIDKKSKAALDQLREKTAVVKLREQPQMLAAAPPAVPRNPPWVLYGSVGILALAGFGVWRVTTRKSPTLLPVRAGAGPSASLLVSCPACAEPISIAAPQLEAAQAEMRRRLTPQLAGLLMNKFVRRLLVQRSDLLDTQKLAAAEMAEMEARLEKLHAPLQDRLRAYEQRIGELEKQLDEKGNENRELIKAKIDFIRHQMEVAGTRVGLN